MAHAPGTCAACGIQTETHEHHIVARTDGGTHLPTVHLCPPCHGLVHGIAYPRDHVSLTRSGLSRARAAGRIGGNPGLRARDPEAIGRLRDARRASDNRRLRDEMPQWRDAVLSRRPRSTWQEIAADIGWHSERLRRTVARAVQLGLVPPAVLTRTTPPQPAHHVATVIRAMRDKGMTLQAIADELMRLCVPCPRGGLTWHPSSVRHLAGR